MYDETYYNSMNYADYLSRSERYNRTAKEITSLLESLCLINEDSTFLDYGCAVGFLAKSLTSIGYDCLGYDISQWAVDQARSKGVSILDEPKGSFDCIFYLDVIEHMSDKEIETVFKNCKSKCSIVRIPCSTDGGNTYHLKVSNQDPTHINCKTKDQWKSFFKSIGVVSIIHINTYTIYDSDGVMCALLINE
jgi:2-polyprenyl-3-methyl-5-hydroxy-6-metoxy-1,4-benzoquinol methylase